MNVHYAKFQKKFDSRTWFFGGKYLVYLGQGEDFKLTTELSEKLQYSRNQAIKDSLNEALNTTYVNKWSFTFKTKLCAFQVTKI